MSADDARIAWYREIAEDKTVAALTLAKEATNGWGCYAKRKIELDEITRLHCGIARLSHD